MHPNGHKLQVVCPAGRPQGLNRRAMTDRVSFSTVVQAYLLLENRGLIEARPRSGFFVRAGLRMKPEEPPSSRPGRDVT